jgi:hypothetical protein
VSTTASTSCARWWPADAAASLAAVDVARVRRLLGRLAGAHLVDRAGDRYSLHDLIRLYVAALPDDGRPDAILRLVDHYLHTAYGATRLLDPHRHPVTLDPPAPGVTPLAIDDRERALAWFIAETPGCGPSSTWPRRVGTTPVPGRWRGRWLRTSTGRATSRTGWPPTRRRSVRPTGSATGWPRRAPTATWPWR